MEDEYFGIDGPFAKEDQKLLGTEFDCEKSDDRSGGGESGVDGLENLSPRTKCVISKLLCTGKTTRRKTLPSQKMSNFSNYSCNRAKAVAPRSKKWTHEEILKLIELYEERPCL